jgi:hypothetical protein
MYVNLPGSYVQLQDGNLSSFVADNSQTVLVIGTASKGLTSEPYLANGLQGTLNEFGSNSEVARGVAEARAGGATNIYVYRLPGVAPYVTKIGADTSVSELGFKVTPKHASPEAAAKYGVAYRHSKNVSESPEDNAGGQELLGELLIVNLETSTIVWSGTAEGGAVVDSGEVDVEFELGDIAPIVGMGTEAELLEVSVSEGTKTYTGVATAYDGSGPGTGATVTVQGLPTFDGTGDYSAITISVVAGGSLYKVDDELYVAGNLLGGTSGTHDLFVTVDTITAQSRTYTNLVLDDGDGHDAGRASITVSASGVYSVTITTQGTAYTTGSDIVVTGDLLGGIAPDNNATVTITANGSGAITGGSVAGSGQIRGAVLAIDNISGTYAAQGFTTASPLTYTFAISGIVATGVTTGTLTNNSQVATALANALNANAEFLKLPFSAETDGSDLYIVASGETNADGDLVYPASHTWAGYTARPFWTAAPTATGNNALGGVTLSTGASYSYGGAVDVGLYPADPLRPFAGAVGGVFVPLDYIKAGGLARSYGINKAPYTSLGFTAYAPLNTGSVTQSVFSLGETGEVLPAMKRYEKLHTCFEELDLASFDYIVALNANLNEKNASESTVTFSAIDDVGQYPMVGSMNDALGYCAIVDNGDYTYTYYWSTDGEILALASDGSTLASAPEGLSFKEVNFAHLVASYCYENSTDYSFVHGLVPCKVPGGTSPRVIRSYFGKAPTYSLDVESGTYYIASSEDNGMGLLGHKFVGGHSDFNGGLKHGGFFATADKSIDYLSPGNLLYDTNGKKIDLGKFISVVSIFGAIADTINPRRPSYLGNAAAMVAGSFINTPAPDSLINVRLPALAINYRTEAKVLDMGSGLGLVMGRDDNGSAIIVDSPTFASPTSDYTRLTSIRIVSKIAKELRDAARPFIGKGLSAPKRNALEASLSEVFKANLAGEPVQTITRGTFTIEQSAADRVVGKMTVKVSITPVFELRQIVFSVNLSA